MRAKESRVARGLYWDSALNLVLGCMPFSEGCTNCWAAREAHMRAHHPHPEIRERYEGLTEDGRFNGTIRYNYKPLHAYQRARKSRVWSVWNDLFHVKVSPEFINTCFEIFQKSRYHTVIVLTKRIGRAYMLIRDGHVRPVPDNVILGTTVELPLYTDRIDTLLRIPARTRMVSLEPLLGPVDLVWVQHGLLDPEYYNVLDWVILGGETGPHARPMHPDWVRSVRDQCQEAGVPFFFKQWGEWMPDDFVTVLPSGKTPKRCSVHAYTGETFDHSYPYNAVDMMRVGRKAAGRLLDGQEWSEYPERKVRGDHA